MKAQPTSDLRLEIKHLRKLLRDLFEMNLRLDPTDKDRREVKAAMRVYKSRSCG